jgi:hypothetical protein
MLADFSAQLATENAKQGHTVACVMHILSDASVAALVPNTIETDDRSNLASLLMKVP